MFSSIKEILKNVSDASTEELLAAFRLIMNLPYDTDFVDLAESFEKIKDELLRRHIDLSAINFSDISLRTKTKDATTYIALKRAYFKQEKFPLANSVFRKEEEKLRKRKEAEEKRKERERLKVLRLQERIQKLKESIGKSKTPESKQKKVKKLAELEKKYQEALSILPRKTPSFRKGI